MLNLGQHKICNCPNSWQTNALPLKQVLSCRQALSQCRNTNFPEQPERKRESNKQAITQSIQLHRELSRKAFSSACYYFYHLRDTLKSCCHAPVLPRCWQAPTPPGLGRLGSTVRKGKHHLLLQQNVARSSWLSFGKMFHFFTVPKWCLPLQTIFLLAIISFVLTNLFFFFLFFKPQNIIVDIGYRALKIGLVCWTNVFTKKTHSINNTD